MTILPGSRRNFFRTIAAAGLAAFLPPNVANAKINRTLRLDDPADALTAMIKMRGSLLAEDIPHWYSGIALLGECVG